MQTAECVEMQVRGLLLKLILNLIHMTKKERLNGLYTKYGLSPEDTFKSPQGWTIITRTGVDAIQASAGIDIRYEVVEYTPGVSASVKAHGSLIDDQEIYVESFGSAVLGGYGKGTTKSLYLLEMAEKRAMARVVLKLSGFYALGVYSEDESDEWKPSEKKAIPANAYAKAQSQILKGEKTYEELIEIIEANYTIGESQKYALKQVKPQTN